jgi:ferredoxin
MTYLVTEECIKCKHMDCVEVCPVDCFYEGENFLVIKPDECIDCGVCEPECPVDAICADESITDEKELGYWLTLNTKYSEIWPNIVEIGTKPADHAEWEGVPNKRELLSPNPGEGS